MVSPLTAPSQSHFGVSHSPTMLLLPTLAPMRTIPDVQQYCAGVVLLRCIRGTTSDSDA